MYYSFSLLTIHWCDSKWVTVGEVETADNWGALLHVGMIYGGEWEFDLLYVRMVKTWVRRKFFPW